jgi:hypothetical protein
MTGDGHRTMRVPLGRACVIMLDGRLRHRRSMRKPRFLTAPARCGSAHRGLLMEVNHEPGAGQDKGIRRGVSLTTTSSATATNPHHDGRACSEVGAW